MTETPSEPGDGHTAVIDRLFPEPHTALDDDALGESYGAQRSPWLRVNFVSSLDGSATRDGRSGGLSDAADRRVFTVLRRLCDAVLVGAGTVRAEGYGGISVDDESVAWRLAHGFAAQPRLAVVSNRLALTPDDEVFAPRRRDRRDQKPLVITSSRAMREYAGGLDAVAEVVGCGRDAVEVADIPGLLSAHGLSRITCEGGPMLFGSLAAAGAVDELCLTMSPLVAGGDGPRVTRTAHPVDASLHLAHVLASGDTLLLRYLREGADQAARAAESRIV